MVYEKHDSYAIYIAYYNCAYVSYTNVCFFAANKYGH